MPESLVLQMVSDARPLAWDELSGFERALIADNIQPWLRSVFEDATKKVSPDEPFEHSRRGRVLFIDGPRGAGKTSFLLTLLRLWNLRDQDADDRSHLPPQIVTPAPPKHIPGLRVLLPVLDFDPLPEDLPIHGWLLEPWRKLLEQPFPVADDQAGREDLLDQLSGVFERVVIGWSKTRPQGGPIQKALAFQEQASGWVDTYGKWVSFVNAMACRSSGCYETDCRKNHRRLFVIAIDDVDLQVEQIPSLLHAIRLLRHPRVLYVLTGDYVHLRFCVQLDYWARHIKLANSKNYNGDYSIDEEALLEGRAHSDKLANALLEKALPEHSRCALPHLGLSDVLLFNRNGTRVRDTLDQATWNELWKIKRRTGARTAKTGPSTSPKTVLEVAHSLQFVTARRAQHAVDRLDVSPKDPLTHQLMFIADLCETSVVPAADNTHQFLVSGKLTTVHGTGLHAWRGDQLRVILSRMPQLVFEPERPGRGSRRRTGSEAHAAFILQLLTENNSQISAGSLQWNPNEGIIRTEVDWNTGSPAVQSVAVFHWPWLARIPASSLYELETISDTIARGTSGFGADDLTEGMLVEWFKHNIYWHLAVATPKLPPEIGDINNFDALVDALKKLRKAAAGGARSDIDLWAIDLQVMAAPYWGLPAPVAHELTRALSSGLKAWKDKSRLREAQWTAISNAIFENNQSLGPADLERFAAKFYTDRHDRIVSEGSESDSKTEMAFWIDDEDREAVKAVRELKGRRGRGSSTRAKRAAQVRAK